MNDYNAFSLELVKLIRGDESQVSFSEKMGYNLNISSKWETGQRRVLWSDFIGFCQFFEWSISEILESVTHSEYSKLPDSVEVVNKLLKNNKAIELLKDNFSDQKIRRLKSGKVRLQFCDFLQILKSVYGREERFLNILLGKASANELYSRIDKSFAIKTEYLKIVANDPMYSLILNCFKLGTYQKLDEHSDLFLSEIIGTTKDQISFRVKYLSDQNIILKVDKLYCSNIEDRHVDTGASGEEASRVLSTHWRKRVLNQL